MQKSRIKKSITAIGVAALMMSINCATSYAAVATAEPYRVSDLKAAKDTDQLILVVGDGTSKVSVSYYTKEGESVKAGPGVTTGTWQEVFVTEGVYGKNGATGEKREGDGKTPTGTYNLTMAFGIKETPGSILPYHQIQQGDYWVDDSNSTYYNKLINVNQTRQSWSSAEDMMASAPYYNYGLVLDHNKDCVPGAGSAIFMHCTKSVNDTGSQGCIRIEEELMKKLVQSVGEKCKIVIVSDVSQLEYQ